MMYRIVHRTNYRYNAPVSRCRNEAHLRPRDTDRQHCLASDLVVEPTPTSWSERSDFFGNPVLSFVVDGPFERADGDVHQFGVGVGQRAASRPPDQDGSRSVESLAADLSTDMLAAREFCFESPLVPPSAGVHAYAEPSFPAGRPVVDAIAELTEQDLPGLRLRPRVHAP